ncbi:MAG: HAMP domain-containing sensor histidine kinase [Bacteroidales bacterium]
MNKWIISSILALGILVISQSVWLQNSIEKERLQIKEELTSILKNAIQFESFKEFGSTSADSSSEKNVIIENMGKIDKTSSNENKEIGRYKLDVDNFQSRVSLSQTIGDVFTDVLLSKNLLRLSSIDSLLRTGYSDSTLLKSYTMKIMKGNETIDSLSVYWARSSFVNFSELDIPIFITLGTKKKYQLKGDFKIAKSAMVQKMTQSIAWSTFAVIGVSVGMLVLLVSLRRKDIKLRRRERTVNGIVHDLKSPLSYVYTMLGFYEKSEQDPDKKRGFETAKKRVGHLAEKIELLLSSFKAQKGLLSLHTASYNLMEHCNEIAMELKEIYINKDITFNFTVDPAMELVVDPMFFDDCMRNLMDNAVKYSGEKPVIEIGMEKSSNYKNTVVVTVKDNGIGIPEQSLKKIFREFYRAENVSERKGYGIGLSFVKRIIQSHGGEIKVGSAKGTGTIFTIFMPNKG